MENRFSITNLAPTWKIASEILKGDVAGHPFHGNQYTTSASIKSAAANLFDRAKAERTENSMALSDARDSAKNANNDFDQKRNVLDEVGSRGEDVSGDGHRDLAENHRALADAHTAMAEKIRGEGGKREDVEARYHERAAQAHTEAAGKHERAATAADKLGEKMVEAGKSDVGTGALAKVEQALADYRDKAIFARGGSENAHFRSARADHFASR